MLILRTGKRVMASHPTSIAFVVIKHGEINYPQWFPTFGRQAMSLTPSGVTDFQAQSTDSIVHHFFFISAEENNIAIFSASTLQDAFDRSIMQVLDDWRLQAITTFCN